MVTSEFPETGASGLSLPVTLVLSSDPWFALDRDILEGEGMALSPRPDPPEGVPLG